MCVNAKPPSKAQQLTFTFHDITCVTVQYIANIWVLFVFYYTTYLRTQNKNDNNNIIAYLLISAILECLHCKSICMNLGNFCIEFNKSMLA